MEQIPNNSEEMKMTSITMVGEYGIGFGSIETLLTPEEEKRLIEIVEESIVPATFENPITCGDERAGLGTVESDKFVEARLKLFGGLAGVYAGLILTGQMSGQDPEKEMTQVRSEYEAAGIKLGGHTDTSHIELVQNFYAKLRGNQATAEELAASKCGANDLFENSLANLARHGNGRRFIQLVSFLDGDNYADDNLRQVVIEAQKHTSEIPGQFNDWKGGFMLAALADKPHWVEVLTDDGMGVHGHRGALISVNRRPDTTLDRRRVAELVADDPLLSDKKPNVFNIDDSVIPRIAEVGAELYPVPHLSSDEAGSLLATAIRSNQISVGTTLTAGTQRVIEIAA